MSGKITLTQVSHSSDRQIFFVFYFQKGERKKNTDGVQPALAIIPLYGGSCQVCPVPHLGSKLTGSNCKALTGGAAWAQRIPV